MIDVCEMEDVEIDVEAGLRILFTIELSAMIVSLLSFTAHGC